MPSARELLEQADALMRKNRTRGDGDIPLLTDAVEVAILPALAPAVAPAPAPPLAVDRARVAAVTPMDVPLLTDVVDEVVLNFDPLPSPPAGLGAFMEGDPSDWLVMDTIDPASHSITGRAPDTLAVVPPMTLKAAGSAATPPPTGSQPRGLTPAVHETSRAMLPPAPAFAAAAPATPVLPPDAAAPPTTPSEPAPAAPAPMLAASVAASPPLDAAPAVADQELWRALAEQVSMQVLQRLDLFTDTGLKEQLAQRLEPIVERASAALVGAITEHVGLLVRTYVSEAIEREIAQWKRDQH